MMSFKDVLFQFVFPSIGGSLIVTGIRNHEGTVIVEGISIIALIIVLILVG